MVNFFDAWWYLQEHELFQLPDSRVSFFDRCLDINVVRVEPGTDMINLIDEAKNTELQVWLEASTPEISDDFEQTGWVLVKDIELDLHASGSTFEAAVIGLYNCVKHNEVGRN
jgi:hypothetical protein